MKATLLLSAIAYMSGCSTPREVPQNAAQPPFFAAIALGLFGHPPDPELADDDIAAIADLGANAVVLPVFWRSSDVTSAAIEPFDYGVSQGAYDVSTIEIARRTHARGLSFGLMPIVQLDRLTRDEWRGTIRPSDWGAWWRSYERFIIHHARIARRAGAEVFSVGSELGSTEHDRAAWSDLIGKVRKEYPGRILYSANWDHYEEVTFWDLVDAIGLSAYYELASDPTAPQEELDAAWRKERDAILSWARPMGKPVHLTEVGYPSQPGAAAHPWDYTREGPADPEAQARCFRAFAAAWDDVSELGGVTIWIWHHGRGGPHDPGYAIAGKPAAEVIQAFFERRKRVRPPG